MPENTAVRVAYFAAGAAVVAAVVAVVSLARVSNFIGGRGGAGILTSGNDEERPPIIVRGGSIIFESGDTTSNDDIDKKGKPWASTRPNHWQPDHLNGIPVTAFTVAIETEDRACPTLDRTRELAITYKDASGTESIFLITTRGRKGSGKSEPTIIGAGLQPGGTADNPQLSFGAGGGISDVRFLGIGGYVDCQATIKKLKVWQDQ